MSNPDVVVVGAGYAGLAAALDLQDAGLSVTVLEARRRVGERAWSVRLANGALDFEGALRSGRRAARLVQHILSP